MAAAESLAGGRLVVLSTPLSPHLPPLRPLASGVPRGGKPPSGQLFLVLWPLPSPSRRPGCSPQLPWLAQPPRWLPRGTCTVKCTFLLLPKSHQMFLTWTALSPPSPTPAPAAKCGLFCPRRLSRLYSYDGLILVHPQVSCSRAGLMPRLARSSTRSPSIFSITSSSLYHLCGKQDGWKGRLFNLSGKQTTFLEF